jgi:hypothetical protein
LGNKKAPTFSGGASVKVMRSSDYARTAPEAREGFPVFVLRLEFVMARELMGAAAWRQRFLNEHREGRK